jgi:hypothetical protein
MNLFDRFRVDKGSAGTAVRVMSRHLGADFLDNVLGTRELSDFVRLCKLNTVGSLMEASKIYMDTYSCTLREARFAVDMVRSYFLINADKEQISK